MEKKLLWCCGFENYEQYKEPLIQRFSETDEHINIFDKFHKAGVLNELRSAKYDYLVLYEFIDQTLVSVEDIELITDNYPDLKIVFIIDNSHKGDLFVQKLLNISFFNGIYEKDLNDILIFELLRTQRYRKAAKFYYQYESDIEQNHTSNEQIANMVRLFSNEETEQDKLVLFERITSKVSPDEALYILSQFPEALIKDLSANTLVSNYIKTQGSQEANKVSFPKKLIESITNSNVKKEEVPGPGSDEDYKVVIKTVVSKVVEEEKSVEFVHVSFDKKILNIWGNPEFGCEFAYYIAKMSGKNVLLIDADTQKPSTSIYLDVSSFSKSSNFNKSGLETIFDLLKSDEFLTKDKFIDVAEIRSDIDNLFIITGGSTLNEAFLSPTRDVIDSLKYITKTAYKNFDIVITLCNESVMDAFTISLMEISDYTIAARHQNIDDLNFLYNQIKYLGKNKNINKEAIKFLAFKYNSDCVDTGLVKNKELFDFKNNYIGNISFNNDRERYKNAKKIYAKSMSPDNCNEYNKILKQFNIVPLQKSSKNPIKFLVSPVRNLIADIRSADNG